MTRRTLREIYGLQGSVHRVYIRRRPLRRWTTRLDLAVAQLMHRWMVAANYYRDRARRERP